MRNICTKRAAAATATYGLLSLTTAVEGFSFSSGIGSQDRHCRSRPCGTSVPRIRTAVSPTATMCAPGEVALTREAGKNAKLAALLKDAGISSVEVPCIAHQDGPDLHLLPAALIDSGLAYVVVTSPEAAKVFLAGWKEAGEPSVSVACVGKATGEALERGGVTPVFTPSKATGETLATEIPLLPPSLQQEQEQARGNNDVDSMTTTDLSSEEAPGRRVLYPASAKAQKTLESGLVARGFEVRRLNTYDTVPAKWDTEAEAAAAAASVAAFGSPSAVKTWAARLGVPRIGESSEEDESAPQKESGGGGAVAACIGGTSARACREAGWPESAIFYPNKPGMDGWAKAVGDALAFVRASSETEATA